MDKYLIDLLLHVKTVIIPGIGALTVVNEATGEIMFMPYLKHDDGKLAIYISEKDGIDEQDARNLVAKYAREIEAKLNIGERYSIYQFGAFQKNSSGDIEFEQYNPTDSQDDQAMESVETEPTTEKHPIESEITIAPTELVHVEPSNEELTSSTKEDELIKQESHTEIPHEEHKPVNDFNLAIDETKEGTETYTEEQQWNDDLDLPPIHAKIERPKKPILEKTQKDKKKRKPIFYVLLTLAVLLIGGTLTVGVFYNSFNRLTHPKVAQNNEETKSKEQDTTAIEDENEALEDSTSVVVEIPEVGNENMEVSKADFEDAIQTSTGTVYRSRPFHLIAGAFTNQGNAERFRDRLRESGNSNAEIIGQFDGLFCVSAGSYATQEDAKNAKSTNGSITRSWIMRWP